MAIKVKVIEKLNRATGDELLLEVEGEPIRFHAPNMDDLSGLVPGREYTLAFVPFVPVWHPAAGENTAPADTLVPVEHPVVLEPDDAADAEAAIVSADEPAAE